MRIEPLEPRVLFIGGGAIDTYFGANGVTNAATVPAALLPGSTSIPMSLTVAPDGNIFVGYYQTRSLHVRRFTSAGVPDRRFDGGNGTGEIVIGGQSSQTQSVVPLADGSVLVA